jgi:hypothetical protein
MKYLSAKLSMLVAPPQGSPLAQQGRHDFYAIPDYEIEDAGERKIRITHRESGKSMLVHETAVERFDPMPELQSVKGGKR